MDLHVVWGWLDTVLNGYDKCFLAQWLQHYCIHLNVQLYCAVFYQFNIGTDWSFSSNQV